MAKAIKVGSNANKVAGSEDWFIRTKELDRTAKSQSEVDQAELEHIQFLIETECDPSMQAELLALYGLA